MQVQQICIKRDLFDTFTLGSKIDFFIKFFFSTQWKKKNMKIVTDQLEAKNYLEHDKSNSVCFHFIETVKSGLPMSITS